MEEEKNWLEWIVFGISALLLSGLIGVLIYLALTHEETDPKLKAKVRYDEKQADKHIYFVELQNEGGITAEEIKIEIIAWYKGKQIEKAELTFPFSPKFSTREGWVSFKHVPANPDSVSTRVLGYLKL